MDNDIEKVILSEEQVKTAVAQLAAQLAHDYAGKTPIFICVLKGASIFFTDLVKAYHQPAELEFMDVSSYGDGFESSGEVKIIKDLDIPVTNRDVIIVEDIIDTGRTLDALTELLSHRGANSVKIVSFLDKPGRRVFQVPVDYAGPKVPNEFLVGYGLDYKGVYRNLPYVGVLKPEIYS